MEERSCPSESDFSEWSDLTEAYRQGFEALIRGDAGASLRMMTLARVMRSFEARYHAESPPASLPTCERTQARTQKNRAGLRLGRALEDLVSGFSQLVVR